MTGKGGLDRTLVRDVLHVFMFPPSTVSPDDSVEKMLRVMIRDTHTRHVYVVDAENRLVGVVRMNRVVEYLFPHVLLRGLAEEEMVWGTHFLESIGAKVVGDIMNDTPCYVLGTDPLSKVGEILTEEKNPEKILGMHIVAPNASEVISAFMPLYLHRLRLADIAKIPYPHMTISEALREIAEFILGEPVHVFVRR